MIGCNEYWHLDTIIWKSYDHTWQDAIWQINTMIIWNVYDLKWCICFLLWWCMWCIAYAVYHEYFIIIHENSDKYFENKCLYHVRWFYILCMMSYSDDWNNDWNNMNNDLESCI